MALLLATLALLLPIAAEGADTQVKLRPKGPALKIVDSGYGKVLSDGRGRALYLFTADTNGTSTCAGECAEAWPPYVVSSRPQARGGAKKGLIGTTALPDGRLQATYRGQPLYYWYGDRKPGQVGCQAVYEFGGWWYVLRRSGRAVR